MLLNVYGLSLLVILFRSLELATQALQPSSIGLVEKARLDMLISVSFSVTTVLTASLAVKCVLVV